MSDSSQHHSKRTFVVEYRCQALCSGLLSFEAADEREAERMVAAKLKALDTTEVHDQAAILAISRIRQTSPARPLPAASAKAKAPRRAA